MQFSAKALYPREFSSFPELLRMDLSNIDARLVVTLQQFRNKTGIPMVPSPRQDAWTRFTEKDKDSQHYAVGRLSTAGDLFPSPAEALTCFFEAIAYPAWGGVGIYTDTILHGSDRPMIHLDIRETSRKVIWARDKDGYAYIHNHRFYAILQKIKRQIDSIE